MRLFGLGTVHLVLYGNGLAAFLSRQRGTVRMSPREPKRSPNP